MGMHFLVHDYVIIQNIHSSIRFKYYLWKYYQMHVTLVWYFTKQDILNSHVEIFLTCCEKNNIKLVQNWLLLLFKIASKFNHYFSFDIPQQNNGATHFQSILIKSYNNWFQFLLVTGLDNTLRLNYISKTRSYYCCFD